MQPILQYKSIYINIYKHQLILIKVNFYFLIEYNSMKYSFIKNLL